MYDQTNRTGVMYWSHKKESGTQEAKKKYVDV